MSVSWIDDHRKREFETFRARFTDREWAGVALGYCAKAECPKVRRHDRPYCDGHTVILRSTVSEYGALVVPPSVRSMDLTADEPWRP